MRLVLSFICTVFLFISSAAQKPSDSIEFENINIIYLEQLIKAKVDSIRQNLGMNLLHIDPILYKAAADHASYLKSKGSISHFQNSKQKRTPLDRVNYYNADNIKSIGENVAWDAVERQTIIDRATGKKTISYFYTYNRLAGEILKGWLNSPPHYKVLSTPYFDVTAVAVAYDQKLKEFFIVQVFGEKY